MNDRPQPRNIVAATLWLDTTEAQGAHGYLRRSESLIVIDPDQSPAMQAKVLAHELGHYFDPTLAEAPELYPAHRGDCEAVAESVAYVVGRALRLGRRPVRGRLRHLVD